MRKLFYILLALPLVFAACEPQPTPEPEPQPQPDPTPDPKPEYVMDVQLAGAFREPSAEFDKPENYFVLSFANDAETILLGIGLVGAEGDTILKAGNYSSEDSTFDLDLCEVIVWETDNEEDEFIYDGFVKGDVVVELAEEVYSFDITLKDAEDKFYHFTYEGVVMDMEPAPAPEAKTFNPIYVEAYRAQGWDLGNFELDLYINDELYHALDMQDNINPNENYLSEGFYSMDNGGVTQWSNFVADIETGEGAYVVDAEITISHNADGTTSIKGFFESEYGHHLDIDWTGVVAGFVFGGTTPEPPTPGEGFEFTAPYFACEYYSAGSLGTPANNYYVILSDDEACNTQNPAPSATYIVLDLYSALEQDTLPLGTYTFDANDSGEDGTLGFYYSSGLVLTESGEPQEWYGFSGGTVTVTEGKIYAELTREDNGGKVTVTYEGDLAFSNGGGGSTTPVEGDVDVNISGAGVHEYYYGDWYGVGADLWWVEIYEDDNNKSGRYIQLELLVDPAYDDWRGTFTALNDASTSYFATFVPGEIVNSSLSGAWYAELENGYISGAYAPIVDGTVECVFNEDGSKTIVLDCVDDAGNKIAGTVTSAASAQTYSARTQKNHISLKRSVFAR